MIDENYKDDHYILTIANGEVVVIEQTLDEYGGYSPAVAEIMQYTGLKDTNGQEVCEGDIIKTQEKYISRVVRGYSLDERGDLRSGVGFFRVGLKEKSWRLKDQQMPVYSCGTSILYDLASTEIIGNIYANPELIK